MKKVRQRGCNLFPMVIDGFDHTLILGFKFLLLSVNSINYGFVDHFSGTLLIVIEFLLKGIDNGI